MKLYASILVFFIVCIAWSCDKKEDNNDPPVDLTDLDVSVKLIEDEVGEVPIVVVGSKQTHFIVAFERQLEDGTMLALQPTTKELPLIMEDEAGNVYDLFGEVVEGPDQGRQLKTVNGFIGYWFAWATFYPGLELFGETPPEVDFEPEIPNSQDWTVPTAEVRDGGPGQDGIPALENPGMFEGEKVRDYLDPSDLVVGVKVGEVTQAYPHAILDWHEIVNLDIGDSHLAVIYCPLTGTATGWNRDLGGEVTTFGVSGLLYNTNIIPYDRATGSRWSQVRMECINGRFKGDAPEHVMVVETSWAAWEKMYPNTTVVNEKETGYSRDYGRYPYGSYRTSDLLIFPVDYPDDRLELKERVYGLVVNGQAKAYQFSDFRG